MPGSGKGIRLGMRTIQPTKYLIKIITPLNIFKFCVTTISQITHSKGYYKSTAILITLMMHCFHLTQNSARYYKTVQSFLQYLSANA